MKLRPGLFLLLLLAAAGCARLENVGKAPDFTAPGRPEPAVAPIAPERIALAAPRPVDETTTAASLWRQGRDSLFGDRRAQAQGDILTVVIEIDESAEISNASARSRSGSQSAAAPFSAGRRNRAERAEVPPMPFHAAMSM